MDPEEQEEYHRKQQVAEDTEAPDEPEPQAAGKPVSFAPKTTVQEVTDEEAEKIRAGKDKLVKEKDLIWSQEELDETEEYVPDVRENPGKVGIRFTERPRPGVPVRNRGQIAPFPKDAPKAEGAPPMIAGDEMEDENDPVWLKDKADKLMVRGDYSGAYTAYTEALKLASNARCFANRAVAAMYQGNLEQCLEDCNHSLRILDLRNKARPGEMENTADPEDQKVRARVEVRMGVAYLWLGAFGKSEAHFQKAIDTEHGLEADDIKQVQADLERIKKAKEALVAKEKADAAARTGGENEQEVIESALALYNQAEEGTEKESAVIQANQCFARLRAGQLKECVEDADLALENLKRWPVPSKAPKAPARPARLDPPYLDDPTFIHPDKQNQGEREWLLKHSGGEVKNLPSIPDDYEWIKDAAEKNDNAWIAVKKRLTKASIDAIKAATHQLQDALYLRQPYIIKQAVEVAIAQNKDKEGPSNKAIQQAMEYQTKLEEHEKEKEAEREKEEAEEKKEVDEFDLEEALNPRRTGVGQAGFSTGHPVENTRRRLFVKVLLRRSRAHELLGHVEAAADDLRSVLKVEPANPEAKKRLAVFSSMAKETSAASSAPAEGSAPAAPVAPAPVPVVETAPAPSLPAGPSPSAEAPRKEKVASRDDELDDEDDEGVVDHASTAALVNSAAEYMKKADYPSALQIYNYARNTTKEWESPLMELKVLSNASLCLQRIRGRLPELISACNDTVRRINQLRESGECKDQEEMLLRMEAASLSRRGSAYAQQRKTEQSAQDAARVKELLAQVAELEKAA
mmetsp:Transcript_75705/g.133692  ORF Transcript_75705/g.133692 Transcript_75705/m.133692 type:complete len:802 (+) Transcript_75705:188-2593(+)